MASAPGRGILVGWSVSILAFAVGGACHSGAGSTADLADAAAGDGATERSATAAPLDAMVTEVANPILAIPGLSVWLDPGVGVSRTAAGVETWTDRSAMKHTFIVQTATDTLPTLGVVGSQPGLVFNGRNRALIEGTPSPAQEDSLTFGSGGFALALVFRSSTAPTDPVVLAAMQGPWLGLAGPDISPLVTLTPLYLTLDSAGLKARVAEHDFQVEVPAAQQTSTHLFVLNLIGEHLTIRLDGHVGLDAPNAFAGVVPSFDYEPLYIGEWDFDFRGFSGAVGDVMVVKGAAAPTSIDDLERYLLEKYAI
jgi:hypothetical protein